MARMIGARRVFELGSGFGYSTAFFAKAVQENGGGVGSIMSSGTRRSRSGRAATCGALGYDGIVHYHVGEAVADAAARPMAPST